MHPISGLLLPVLATLLAATGLAAGEAAPADPSISRYRLADGSVVTGILDADRGLLTIVDGRTGEERGTMQVAKADIKSTEKIKLAAQPRKLLPGADGAWITDAAEARRLAKLSGRPIAWWFTGSDWCGWCIKLDKEVFATPEFKAWAAQNVILVVCDFPRRTAIAPELRKQNEELARTYEIQGYPTIVFTDGQGRKLGEHGYQEGGPAAWIATVRKELGNKVR